MNDSKPDPRQPLPNDAPNRGPEGREASGAPAPRPAGAGPVPGEIQVIVDALDDRRAKDIVVLDLEGVSESLSFFVIATGESAPQMRAMQESVRMAMKEAGEMPSGVEGPSERWVLIDYGPIVVHLMSPEAREFYDIEGLWADARPMDIAPSA